MRIIDVDAHFHEPVDWLQKTDPALAELLGPPARFIDIAGSIFGINNPATSQLPRVIDGESILTPERQTRMITHWRTVFGIR